MNQKYYLLLNVGNIEWKQSTSEILKLDLFLSLLQLCRLSCCMTDERSAPHSLLAMLTDISNTARDDKDLVWNTGELNSFITVLSSVESFIVMKYFQRGIQIPLLCSRDISFLSLCLHGISYKLPSSPPFLW